MDDRAMKDLTRELRAVASQLRRRYKQRFREAGADLIAAAGRAGTGRVGQPPVAVLQLHLEMEVDGFVRVAYFDVAEKNPEVGWRQTQDVAAVQRRATERLDEWIRELESS